MIACEPGYRAITDTRRVKDRISAGLGENLTLLKALVGNGLEGNDSLSEDDDERHKDTRVGSLVGRMICFATRQRAKRCASGVLARELSKTNS